MKKSMYIYSRSSNGRKSNNAKDQKTHRPADRAEKEGTEKSVRMVEVDMRALLSIIMLAGYREKQIEQWLQDDGR